MAEDSYKAPAEGAGTPHSRFGFASLLAACSMALLFVAILAISELIDARHQSLETLCSILLVVFLLGNLLAIALGIVAIVQKRKRKLLGVVGMALACVLLAGLVVIAVCSEPRPMGGPVEIHMR